MRFRQSRLTRPPRRGFAVHPRYPPPQPGSSLAVALRASSLEVQGMKGEQEKYRQWIRFAAVLVVLHCRPALLRPGYCVAVL